MPIRQDYLENVLKWISCDKIEEYMARHQLDENSDTEWQYFQQIIIWAQTLFPKEHYSKEMKGLARGEKTAHTLGGNIFFSIFAVQFRRRSCNQVLYLN